MNPIGIISMQFARPFVAEHFAWFPKIKALGYDFIELLVPEPGELDWAVTRRALSDAGLGVVLAARVNLDRNLTSDDAARRQAGVDYLRYCIEAAQCLGAGIVGGPFYGNPLVFAGRAPMPVEESQRRAREAWAVEGLQAVAPMLKGSGVRFAIEALNRFETDIVNTTQQAVSLAQQVGCADIGVLLDTFHMNMEDDDLAASIRQAGSRIVHFQANENHRGFVGTGHVDWRAVCSALAEIDYRGPVSLEPFRRDNQRIAVPRAQWKPPSSDESEALRRSAGLIREQLALARRSLATRSAP